MSFKFEKLDIWKMSMDYLDVLYEIAELLPKSEDYNVKSQTLRAGTSICLTIAEGSTGQTDTEKTRFLGIGLRSLFETVGCQHIVYRRKYLARNDLLCKAYRMASDLAPRITKLRTTLDPDQKWVREERAEYVVEEKCPFEDD